MTSKQLPEAVAGSPPKKKLKENDEEAAAGSPPSMKLKENGEEATAPLLSPEQKQRMQVSQLQAREFFISKQTKNIERDLADWLRAIKDLFPTLMGQNCCLIFANRLRNRLILISRHLTKPMVPFCLFLKLNFKISALFFFGNFSNFPWCSKPLGSVSVYWQLRLGLQGPCFFRQKSPACRASCRWSAGPSAPPGSRPWSRSSRSPTSVSWPTPSRRRGAGSPSTPAPTRCGAGPSGHPSTTPELSS